MVLHLGEQDPVARARLFAAQAVATMLRPSVAFLANSTSVSGFGAPMNRPTFTRADS